MNTKAKSGFTIIEVVLVLAIAGLIFLMVFIALPNMQASRRNTQRRNDYSALETMIASYVSNNNGKMPTSIRSTWFNSTGQDPDGETYTVSIKDLSSNTASITAKNEGTVNTGAEVYRNSHQAVVYTHATCGTVSGDTVTLNKASGQRTYAVVGYVEDGANTPAAYCHSGNA